MKNVKISDIGIEYKTPSSLKKTGKTSANPTSNTISYTIDNNGTLMLFPTIANK